MQSSFSMNSTDGGRLVVDVFLSSCSQLWRMMHQDNFFSYVMNHHSQQGLSSHDATERAAVIQQQRGRRRECPSSKLSDGCKCCIITERTYNISSGWRNPVKWKNNNQEVQQISYWANYMFWETTQIRRKLAVCLSVGPFFLVLHKANLVGSMCFLFFNWGIHLSQLLETRTLVQKIITLEFKLRVCVGVSQSHKSL